MDSLFDLSGRVAIVTGGGTGIGAATARLLAAHGADVVIAARAVEDLERTSRAVEADTGRRCLPVRTDVKDEEQVVRLVRRSAEEFGRIDILVNNAGGTRLGPLRDLPTKAWDASFDLNVRSAYVATRETGRHFLEQGSGSSLGRVGRPDEVAAAVLFFAGDAASYISGQTLSVDGGPHLGGILDV